MTMSVFIWLTSVVGGIWFVWALVHLVLGIIELVGNHR
jgi:hypothetical protein